jgi:mutator family transposase
VPLPTLSQRNWTNPSARELDCEYPYPILDARYEKVRENAVIRSRALLVAIGIDWEGRHLRIQIASFFGSIATLSRSFRAGCHKGRHWGSKS